MAVVPNKSDGNALSAAELFKFIGKTQQAAATGSVGTTEASFTIPANSGATAVLVLWNFRWVVTGSGSAGFITPELAIGATRSEEMKISKRVYNAIPSGDIDSEQISFLMWYEDGLDFTVENKVIVGFSGASFATITNISLVVIGV